MAKKIAPGKSLEITNASGATLASGTPVLKGSLFGVCATDIADTEKGTLATCGVYPVAKAAEAVTQGAKLYWDSGTSKVTVDGSGSKPLAGYAYTAALSGDAEVEILLNGTPD